MSWTPSLASFQTGYGTLYESGRVTEPACWGHFRRGFFDLRMIKPAPLTTDLLERIGQLYAPV